MATGSKDMDDNEKQVRFMALYQDCHTRISRYCRALGRDNEDARDLLSDTVLRVYENFEKITKPESFLYFLFGTASRLHRKRTRRLKFRGVFKQTDADNLIDHAARPDDVLELQLLFEAMQRLPAAQREALALFEISGLSLKEIQEIQHCTLSTAKARISRARQKLALWLRVQDEAKILQMEQPSQEEKPLKTILLTDLAQPWKTR